VLSRFHPTGCASGLLSIAAHVALGAVIRSFVVQPSPATNPTETSNEVVVDATLVPSTSTTPVGAGPSRARAPSYEPVLVLEKRARLRAPAPAATQKSTTGVVEAGATQSGVDGGIVRGSASGPAGAELAGDTTAAPPWIEVTVPFGEGMTPPSLIGGAARPSYTREALEAKIEGKVIARCTITVEGRLTDCRILKGLPFLDRAVLSTLAAQRYTPVRYQGRARAVFYTLTFRFELP
jgi:protein TonB